MNTLSGGSTTHAPEYYMHLALREAEKAARKGETPVGAVLVRRQDGTVLAKGHNLREIRKDPTCHAEIEAIRKGSRKLRDWRLNDCDLYVTLEPCAMCAGAILQARVGRLFYGAADPKAGAAGSLTDLFSVHGFNHRVDVTGGILADACAAVLKKFFAFLRKPLCDIVTDKSGRLL